MAFLLDVQFIQQTEAKLGLNLPPAYVARMCRNNGGEVQVGKDEFCLHPILDTSDRKHLARTCNDIIRESASARKWPGFPKNALVIGNNGGGDLLILLPEESGLRYADAVYWWDHETGEVIPAADTFEDLA